MTTKKDLHALADAINQARQYRGLEAGYLVRYAYGRPRLERELQREDGRYTGLNISPRLTPKELELWMYAYLAGMDAATNPNPGY